MKPTHIIVTRNAYPGLSRIAIYIVPSALTEPTTFFQECSPKEAQWWEKTFAEQLIMYRYEREEVMNRIIPPASYHLHLVNAVTRRCAYCGVPDRDIQLGHVSKYCKGPVGAWATPGEKALDPSTHHEEKLCPPSSPQPTRPVTPSTPSDGFNKQEFDKFMRGL